MKYITKPKLRTAAEAMNIYIAQDRDGTVNLWETAPHRNLRTGRWEHHNSSPVNRKDILAPYTRNWDRSLITPKTKEYMEND